MSKLAAGMLLGFGAAIAGWWYYSKTEPVLPHADRGVVIFSNTPVSG